MAELHNHTASMQSASASPPPPGLSSSAVGKKASPATGSATKIKRRNRIITSCLQCRQRKLKCDKQNPCANCTKFSRQCVFLASSLDAASQRKINELKEQVGTLERTLEEEATRKASLAQGKPIADLQFPGDIETDSENDSAVPEDELDLEPTELTTVDAAYDDDADDEVVDLGIAFGKVRVSDRIGGLVRPKFAQELGSVLEQESGPGPQHSIPDNSYMREFMKPGPDYIAPPSSFMFASNPKVTSLLSFLPKKEVTDRLVGQYFFAVHPIARAVHRPSFERQYAKLWQDIYTRMEPRPSFQAVVMAAIFSAVVSLSEEDVLHQFGSQKSKLVESLREGTEAALAKCRFLQTSKVEVLQAFIMYLIPLCRGEISRAQSSLVGAAVRLAQMMGLQRDATIYGMNPVDVHVRRMLWHQLCFLDIRTCEATGPRPQFQKHDYDTKFPLNVDDIDLESPNPPTEDSKRWTDMTMSRIRFECNEVHRMVWVERPRIDAKKSTLQSVMRKCQRFIDKSEKKYFPMMDKHNPLHVFAWHTFGVLSKRLYIGLLHRYASSPKLMPERLRQTLMTSACLDLEHAISIEVEASLKPWAWYAGAFQQYQITLALISYYYYRGQQYIQPPGSEPSEEDKRLWRIFDFVFDLDPTNTDYQEKARFVLEGLKSRSEYYQAFRKMRAPTAMADPKNVYPGAASQMSSPATSNAGSAASPPGQTGPQSVAPTTGEKSASVKPIPTTPEFVFNEYTGMANGEALFAPPLQHYSPQEDSESGNYGSNDVPIIPQPQGPTPEMFNFDWEQYDRMFPTQLPPMNAPQLPATGGAMHYSFPAGSMDTLNWTSFADPNQPPMM